MKYKIESDVFDIVERIKDVDDGYFVLYDDKVNKFEIHSYKQKNTFCFSVDCCCFDKTVLDKLFCSNVKYIDNIIEEIDNNNIKIENYNKELLREVSSFNVKEIYEFSSNSSKDFNVNDFNMRWV